MVCFQGYGMRKHIPEHSIKKTKKTEIGIALILEIAVCQCWIRIPAYTNTCRSLSEPLLLLQHMQIYTRVWKLHVFNPKVNQKLNKSIKFWFLQITGCSNWLNWLVSRCRGPVVSTEKLWWLWGIWLYWNENYFSLLMVAFHLRLMQTVFILLSVLF